MSSDATTTALPLSGIRVLDLSRVFAGPVAGRVLSDLGAEVVKVEPPDGDMTRFFGRKTAGMSTYFTQQNVGKENICIDLQSDGGPELVLALVEHADIVIENFRPGVMARYGLDYESLRQRKPDLIMLSISGFGQDGPESGRAAFAAILHAEAGAIAYDGQAANSHDVSFSAADVLSGMHGVVGLMAALRVRDQTGVGQHIDIAMMDAMTFSSDGNQAMLDNRGHESRGGQIFDAVDGPVLLSGDMKYLWHMVSKTHGLIDAGDPERSIPEKKADRRRLITEFFCGLADRAALRAALDECRLPWADIRQLGEVLESPTIVHRDTVATIDDRDGGTRRVIRNPYRMSETDARGVGSISHRGEHNREVLGRWLSMSDTDVDALTADGVLLQDDWAQRLDD